MGLLDYFLARRPAGNANTQRTELNRILIVTRGTGVSMTMLERARDAARWFNATHGGKVPETDLGFVLYMAIFIDAALSLDENLQGKQHFGNRGLAAAGRHALGTVALARAVLDARYVTQEQVQLTDRVVAESPLALEIFSRVQHIPFPHPESQSRSVASALFAAIGAVYINHGDQAAQSLFTAASL